MNNSKIVYGKIVQIYQKQTKTNGNEYLFLKVQGKGGERKVVFAFNQIERWGELSRNGKFYEFELTKSKRGNWNLLNWKRANLTI